MSKAVIQTNGLTKVFKDFWQRPQATAVSDLSFSIEQGQVYGLLGPNGSGKSTTIKMILGILFPTRGQIAVFGQPATNVENKQRIGFLPEESYLYRYLNAEETLDFYGRLFKISRSERKHRVESLLDLAGLQGARKRLLSEYSKGMARRIGIAQALINDPELVILDEPTAGLDPLGTREIKDLIVQLKAKGKTVLLSSHLLSDVEDVCDRILILYGGKIQAEGSTVQLLNKRRLTQVTAQMDQKTIKDVEVFLKNRLGEDAELNVKPATERLEKYFLQVVTQARQAKTQTSGVEESGKKLDFLSGSTTEEVLSRLKVEPDEIRKKPVQEKTNLKFSQGSALVAKQPGKNVLEKLVKEKSSSTPAATSTTSKSQPERKKTDEAENVNHDLLQSLTESTPEDKAK